jgi:hypothetical protein
MGFSNTYLEFMAHAWSQGHLLSGGTCLGIGTFDFWIDYESLKRHRIQTITPHDLERHSKLRVGSEEWSRSCKALSIQLLQHFGYNSYKELDINDRADIVWDLNLPVPEYFKEHFDLVVDISVPYVSNIIQAYLNVMASVKLSGEYATVLALGDQTNRYQLAPSPNFLIDFLNCNGFQVLYQAIFSDACGYIMDYQRQRRQSKITPLGKLLPWFSVLSYNVKQLITDAVVTENGCLRPVFRGLSSLLTPPGYYLFIIAKKIERTADIPKYPLKDVYAGSSVLHRQGANEIGVR